MRSQLSLTTAIVMSLNVSGQTIAQSGPWAHPFEEPFESNITHATVELASEVLTLSDSQTSALAQNLSDHQRRFAELATQWKPVRRDFDTRISNLIPNTVGWFNLEVEREATLAEAADAQAALDAEFLAHVQEILAPGQSELYPRFLQRFNRTRWFAVNVFGFPESGIDIRRLVLEIAENRDTEPSVESLEVLGNYETELDLALCEYVAFQIKLARQWLRRDLGRYKNDGKVVWMNRGTDDDYRRTIQEGKQVAGLRERIRDINHRYAILVPSLLPGTLAQEFQRRYLEEALAPFLQPDALVFSAYVERVLALDDLAREQRDAIIAAVAQEQAEGRVLDEKILNAANEWVSSRYDTTSTRERTERESATNLAVANRIAANEKALRYVYTLLSPDQQQRFPLPLASATKTRP